MSPADVERQTIAEGEIARQAHLADTGEPVYGTESFYLPGLLDDERHVHRRMDGAGDLIRAGRGERDLMLLPRLNLESR